MKPYFTRKQIEQGALKGKGLELLWLTLLNRPITAVERAEAVDFLKQAGDNAWTELCHALLASNEFLIRM